MRYVLIILLVLVVGGIGAVLWLLRDPNAFRPELESLINDRTGLKVRFDGDLSWRLWPPVQLVVHDVAADWTDPGSSDPLLKASAVRLDADLLPLLGANPRLEIHGVAVEGLHARLVQTGAHANWMPPGYEGEAVPPVPIPPPTDTAPPADAWVIHSIDVRDSVVDYAKDGDSYRIDVAKLAIANIAPDKPVPIDGKVTVTRGDTVTSLDAAAKVTFNPTFSRWSLRDVALSGDSAVIGGAFDAKLDADVDTTAETLMVPRADAKIGDVDVRVTVSGTGIVTKPSYTGRVELPTQNLAKLLAPFDVNIAEPVGVRGDFAADKDNVALRDAEIEYGETKARGGAAVRFGTPKRATFDLVVDRYVISDDKKAPPVAVSGGGPFPFLAFAAPIATIDPSLDEPLIPLDVRNEYEWDGKTKIGTRVYQGQEFPNASIQTSKSGGVIRADVSLPSFFGGHADAKVNIDGRGAEPQWTVSPKLVDVQSEALLKFLDQRLDWVALLLAGSDLTMHGNTPRQLIGTLKGKTTFDGGKGKLNIAALKQQVQSIAILAGKDDRVAKWPDVLDYQKFTGTWDVDGSKHDLALDLDNLSMVARGSYDPLAQDMDMRVAVTVKSNVEPKPFQIDPLFMDVALPLRCRGSTEEPQCTADQEGVKKLIASALSGQGNPEMQRKLDKAIEERVPEQYRDAARDLLKGLFGQPQPKEQQPAPQSAP